MGLIKATGLTAGYHELIIVDNLDIALLAGKLTSIIGGNGCGKSTILKSLARLHPMKSGVVYLDGKDIKELSGVEIAKKMSILPQAPTAPAGLTVEDLVAYGRYPHQKGFGKLTGEDKGKICWALDITGMSEFKYRDIDALSGGQRQRVWIAMALAQDTDLILLDEPTTYLDLVHQLEVLQLLKKLNKEEGKTIALVIHDLNMAARFSDHMIAIKDGKIATEGTPKEIMTTDVLRDVFNMDAVIVEDPRYGAPTVITYDTV